MCSPVPSTHVTFALAKFEGDMPNDIRCDIAQYPHHHMTYAPAKFEVAYYNSLGVDAFTRTT